MELDPKQIEAINACCDATRRVVAVTGAAGTGKTTIMRQTYEKLVDAGYRVVICAPTGRAAKRVQEATGIPARTIHRLLEYSHPGDPDPRTGKPIGVSAPRRDARNPLDIDVVLADEYAMVNTEVHRNLMDAMSGKALLRVFGDANQLPPIEETGARVGTSPFKQLLDTFKGIVLDVIHRQGEGSGIVTNGARVLKGYIPVRNDEFAIRTTDSTTSEGVRVTRPIDRLREAIADYRERGIDFTKTTNQIITPSNKNWVGTFALNQLLQQELMPADRVMQEIPRHDWIKRQYKINKMFFGVGDKVVYTQNNYELEVFNGECGIITDITEYGEVEIDLTDRKIVVPPVQEWQKSTGETVTFDPRKSIDLAFAMTTHKCQGAEYEVVIYILDKSITFMLNRHNFYTALTRARKHVTVISDTRSLSLATTKKEAMI